LWLAIVLSAAITASVILVPSITSAWASAHAVKVKPSHARSAVTATNSAFPDLLPGFAKKQLAGGLNHPVVFAFAPNGDIYVGEQGGTILIYRNGAILATPLGTINTDGSNEKGLLGLAVDPNYATNGYVYVSYTTVDEHAQLSRFTVQNSTINLSSEVVFMKGNQLQNPHHSANDLHIGPDGKLWWSVGDNVPSISNAQTLSNIYGKILRFRLDGSIPSDNPFLHVPGAVPAIYAYGLRNPFRFTFLPNGQAMTEDTGSSYWEEMDTIQAGGNYGWDFYEGNCGSCGYINTAYAYGHLPTDGAASAIAAYSGAVFPKQYDNVVFFGDYNRQDIEAVAFDPTYNTEVSDTVFDNAAGTIADLQEGPDGNLYFVSIFNNTFSEIYTTGPFPPTASISSSPNAGLAPLTVQFSSAGSSDPYGLPLTYSWDFGDGSPASTSPNPSHIYTTNGTYTATLTVSNGSQTASASIQVVVGNTPPTASITSPAVNATYNAGDTISFSGTATDAVDGTLPASAYTWQVDFYSNGVAQPFYSSEVPQPFYGPVSGVTSGTFQIPRDLSNTASTFYRITMTVVDSLGLQTVVTQDIHPNTTNWSVNTNIPGAAYVVDGTWHASPYSTQDGTGVQHVLTGVPTQTIGTTRYRFNGWSDGSALTDSFANPAGNATYTANYDQVSSTMPSPWQSVDVGSPLVAGTADYSASDQTFYIDGAGADIYGSNDQFHYVYQPLNGDGTIVARVRYQTNSSPWTKAGVMIKQSTTAGSSYVNALVTPDVSPNTPNINGVGCTVDGCLSPLPPITPTFGNGVRMQYNFTGSKTATNLTGYSSPNKWLKLQRAGNTFTTWESTDGKTWTQIGSTSVTMSGPVTIGLFVTSHNIGQTSSVAFDNVQVTTQASPPPPGPLPSPWIDTDVGSPAIAGSASYANGVFTVNGAGADIYGTNDQFNYVYQPVNGNGTLIARVMSQTNTSSNAKAGIMFKQSTTAGSSYILITITPGTSSFKIQYNFNGSIGGGTYTFPNAWMKLTRVGTTFTAYVSADGVTWTQVVSKSLNISTNATAGLFECSHNANALGTATFDNVSFTPGP
jgi:glucose/arabinose dehydrogenase/regulation of enolase protein 1 (concanavalin A-like superfamily)